MPTLPATGLIPATTAEPKAAAMNANLRYLFIFPPGNVSLPHQCGLKAYSPRERQLGRKRGLK
jgi:hypothetical protein